MNMKKVIGCLVVLWGAIALLWESQPVIAYMLGHAAIYATMAAVVATGGIICFKFGAWLVK